MTRRRTRCLFSFYGALEQALKAGADGADFSGEEFCATPAWSLLKTTTDGILLNDISFLSKWWVSQSKKTKMAEVLDISLQNAFREDKKMRNRCLSRYLYRGQNWVTILRQLYTFYIIKNYIHIIDFLTHLCFRMKYNNAQIKMTSKKLAVLLNVSHATLPGAFRRKSLQVIRVEDIVKFQKERLRLSNNRISNHGR